MALSRPDANAQATSTASRANAANRAGPRRGTKAFAHALDAAVRAELLCVRGLWAALPEGALAANAFGDEPRVLGRDLHDAAGALAACEQVAAEGGRAAAVVSLASLVDARRKLIGLVERRRPVVVHAVVSVEGASVDAATHADLHALGDVGVAILAARDAQDAADLVLVAHRAAEDAETPVVIVHDGYPASLAVDRVVLPDAPLVRGVLEPAPAPLGPTSDTGGLPHRRAAARIPFALSSAMRAFERHSARRIEAVEASHVEGAEIVLVASGAVAESARATVERMHHDGHDPHLGVVQVVTLRPFPGPQIVKAIGRARAVGVVERADEPLRQSNPLAVELKSAFVDALTWAAGYPGIGRIPLVFAACIDPGPREATPGEILAVVDGISQGENAPRTFRVSRDGRDGRDVVAPAAERHVAPGEALSIRWVGDPAPLFRLVVDLYGGHARATPRAAGDAPVHDVVLAPSPVRAHHGATELDAVVVDPGVAQDDPVVVLRDEGVVLVCGAASADAAMGALSPTLRSEIRARRARVFAVPPAGEPRERAAMLCGALLRAVPPPDLDRAQILADAERSVRATAPALADADVRALLDAFARGLEQTAEVAPDAKA